MLLIAAGLAAPLASTARAQNTMVEELVCYYLDSDLHIFGRFEFYGNTFSPMGVVYDEEGYEIDHPEGLAYLAFGDNKGFYASPMGKDGLPGTDNTLWKIDGLTGEAYSYPVQFNYRAVRGMTTVYPPLATSGQMYAICHNNWNSMLVSIDPVTGLDTAVWAYDANTYGEAEGLSRSVNPNILFLGTAEKIYTFSLLDGTITQVADHTPHRRLEALEIAFGDTGPSVNIPGIPTSWTHNGALIGFTDNLDVLMVYNLTAPGPTGQYVQYDSALDTQDAEGLVFMTRSQDPWGKITVDAHD